MKTGKLPDSEMAMPYLPLPARCKWSKPSRTNKDSPNFCKRKFVDEQSQREWDGEFHKTNAVVSFARFLRRRILWSAPEYRN